MGKEGPGGFKSLEWESDEAKKARLEREALAGEEAGEIFTKQAEGELTPEQIDAAEKAARDR